MHQSARNNGFPDGPATGFGWLYQTEKTKGTASVAPPTAPPTKRKDR